MTEIRDLRLYARHFLLSFVPFTAFMAGVLFYFSWQDEKQEMAQLQADERLLIAAAANSLDGSLQAVVSDAFILAHSAALLDFLSGGAPVDKVGEEFELFSQGRRTYDQIRFIDMTGQEVVRVNFGGGEPFAVPRPDLQNKADRYYFNQSKGLARGTVFMSPIDLNVEGGEIEVPLKPMIRFATPVFDRDDRRQGIIVVNFLAEGLLSQVAQRLSGSHGDIMIVNEEGHILKGPNPSDEWGFMFGREPVFAEAFPTAWKGMSELNGQVLSELGLFTFEAIRPLDAARGPTTEVALIGKGSTPAEAQKGYRWFILTMVDGATLKALTKAGNTLPIGLTVSTLVILALSASYARVRVQQARAQRLLRLAAKVEEVTADGVIISDRDGKIVSVNHAFTAITGFLPHEVIGRTCEMIRSRQRDGDTDDAARRAHALNSEWDGEVWNRRKDGHAFPSHTRLAAIREPDGDIDNFVEIFSDIADRKAEEMALKHQANHDALTGLPNRALFEDRLRMAIQSAQRHGEKFALLFIDLDRFKPVNDDLGHDVGDVVLCEIANRLRGCLRGSDTVARIGGDEFVAILPELENPERAGEIAAKFHTALKSPINALGHECRIGASIGIAIYPQDGTDGGVLLKKADSAMYEAKRAEAEGNTVRYYSAGVTLRDVKPEGHA